MSCGGPHRGKQLGAGGCRADAAGTGAGPHLASDDSTSSGGPQRWVAHETARVRAHAAADGAGPRLLPAASPLFRVRLLRLAEVRGRRALPGCTAEVTPQEAASLIRGGAACLEDAAELPLLLRALATAEDVQTPAPGAQTRATLR